MGEFPVYKIGHENSEDYIEIVELQERNEYDASKPHKHAYVEIFLFAKGGGVHDIDFEAYPIRTNSIHFVFPNQIHKVARELDTFGHVLLISREYFSQLDYDLFVQLFYGFYLNPCMELEHELFDEIAVIIAKIKSELSQAVQGYKSVVKGYLMVLFNLFLRFRELEDQAQKRSSREFKVYMDLLLLVENHYLQHHPVSFYSDQLHVSSRKLNDICKEFNDSTCSNIINDRIVLEAKKMLLHSDQSVKDTQYALNYKDAAYFNRFFKSKTGYSPTAFVNQFAKKYKG